MYTIVAQEIFFPVGDVPVSRNNNAPAIEIGDLLAASKSIETGMRSDSVNPAAKQPSRDHKQDWAPVSAIAVILVGLISGRLKPNSL